LYTYKYPRPSVSVDVAIFKPQGAGFQLLLIRRGKEPFQGRYALPGGFINIDESLEEAAQRELFEETGLTNLQLTQIETFSDPNRDPRGRVISTCYGCVLKIGEQVQLQAGDDAAAADWFGLDDLPSLAFDHAAIVKAATWKLLPAD
jgi:8-oxo-dGTP diphosphatase